ncbi:hypothetical protein [Naasia sp. SYSU D00948]|uniref:hypothetical protein n=1 Tax=Naasia sp. SYSU D00948 TaxID=2817379 RepID=UPI001B3114C5|nr:hypothetical protein [Naasia sp. SYSU D00948]
MSAVGRLGGAALALLVMLVAVPASPAAAADEEHRLLLSLDGRSFAQALAVPLFPPGQLLVPGTSLDATVWARNDSPHVAVLTVRLASVSASSGALVDSLQLGARAGEHAGTLALQAADTCALVLSGTVLEPGGVEAIDLTLGMTESAAEDAQGEELSMQLAFVLSEAVAGAPPADCGRGTLIDLVGSAPVTPAEEPTSAAGPGDANSAGITAVAGDGSADTTDGTATSQATPPATDLPGGSAPVSGILAASVAAVLVPLLLLKRKRKVDDR